MSAGNASSAGLFDLVLSGHGSCAEHIAGLAGCAGCAGYAGHYVFMIDLVKTGARGAGPAGLFDLCFDSQSYLASD